MRRRSLILALSFALLVVVLSALTGCSSPTEPVGSLEEKSTPAPAAPAPVDPAPAPADDGLYRPEYVPNGSEIAVFTTSKGVIKVQLTGKDTPIHVGNFVELASKGFYNGTKFHRYVPGFVVQGGDPQTAGVPSEEILKWADNPRSPYGTGGPGHRIEGEFQTNPSNVHVDGALGMARSQDPDSAGSQFYFALAPLPDLDSGYTVFGNTIEGRDVIEQLRIGDEIVSVTIENANH